MSHFEKDLLPIEKQQQQPAQSKIATCEKKRRFSGRKAGCHTSKKEFYDPHEIHKPLKKVYRYRIHANHHKKECPLPPPLHVGEPIEHRKRRSGIPSDAQKEARRPKFLADRDECARAQPGDNQPRSKRQQMNGLASPGKRSPTRKCAVSAGI